VAGCVVVGGVALAACGGGSSTGGGSGTNATQGAEVPKNLKALVGSEFLTLEPNALIAEQDGFVAGLYGATLTKYSDGKQGEPEVAEKLTPNKDFTEWTVKIKSGQKFSDGSPLTAADVVATFDYILEGEGIPLVVLPNLRSATLKGSDTVVLKFAAPEAGFPSIVSSPDFNILPAAGLKQGESFFSHPISAGPYVVDSFGARKAKLSLNPNYTLGKKPEPQSVEISVVEDAGTRLAAVKTGEANWAFDLPGGLIPQITSPAEIQLQPYPGTSDLVMNNKVKPFDDPKVRRAISLALDREAISQAAYGGEAPPLSRYWPSALTEFSRQEQSKQQPTADIAAAERELKGTECESGCSATLLGRSSAPWMQTVQLLVQQQLEAIGIQLTPKLADQATTLEQLEKGEFETAIENFAAGAPAPQEISRLTMLPGVFSASFTGYESPRAEELVEQLNSTPADQQAPVAKEIGDLFAKDAPWANLTDWVVINASNLPESVVRGLFYTLQVGGA